MSEELVLTLEDRDLATFVAEGFAPPPIPADWANTTWRNDVCPSWEVGLLQGWVDHPEVDQREFQDGKRFDVIVQGWSPSEGALSSDSQILLETDDWEAVLRAVNEDYADLAGFKRGKIVTPTAKD